MSTTIKIPMNEETRIALEDCFIDNESTDARKYIFDALKEACKDAKRSTRNKVTPVNERQEDGSMKQQEFSLKGVDLKKYKLDMNPNWLPKGLEAADSTPIELKLGDKTMEFLNIFGELVVIRHEQYNLAEDAFLKVQEGKMREVNAPEENIQAWKKQQNNIRDERMGVIPTCLENALYTSLWPSLQQKLDMSDGSVFEKEFQDEYKPKKEEKITP